MSSRSAAVWVRNWKDGCDGRVKVPPGEPGGRSSSHPPPHDGDVTATNQITAALTHNLTNRLRKQLFVFEDKHEDASSPHLETF